MRTCALVLFSSFFSQLLPFFFERLGCFFRTLLALFSLTQVVLLKSAIATTTANLSPQVAKRDRVIPWPHTGLYRAQHHFRTSRRPQSKSDDSGDPLLGQTN